MRGIQNKTGKNRDPIDQFYTKKEVAEECIRFFYKNISINKKDLLIEPSAGYGSFSDFWCESENEVEMETCPYGSNPTKWGSHEAKPVCAVGMAPKEMIRCKDGSRSQQPSEARMEAFDIDPKKGYMIEKDFLKLDLEKYNQAKQEVPHRIHCIGNPPFGRQSSTARKFIKKCSLFCDTISFILPKSFRKESYQKAFPLNFHLVKEYDLKKDSFLLAPPMEGTNASLLQAWERKETHAVPCIFQIWEKKDHNRFIEQKPVERGFKFVKKPSCLSIPASSGDGSIIPFGKQNIFIENPHFGVLRAGGGSTCGRISLQWEDGVLCYPEAWLFIKLDEKYDKVKFYEEYQKIVRSQYWKDDSNVAAKSISKPIFTKGINLLLRQMDASL